ncbi:MAG: phytanoyl-CoA dioxygenase family protein [Myxococcales bacterium]|nr:phytanoyl-CoA dioxygenase family protein [Myxococcales bacterium]
MNNLLADMKTRGVAVARGALPIAVVTTTRETLRPRLAAIDAQVAAQGPWATAAREPRYVPTANSLRLDLDDVAPLRAALDAALGATLAAALGAPHAWMPDQCWLRRQFAPAHARPPHAPHGWHQDGALGFDFLGGDPTAPDALLPMLTCWTPLVPCGADAPGLRYEPRRRETLIGLADLASPTAFEAPTLTPGDVILLHGGTLHATHATADMTRDRLSVELRCLPHDHPGRLHVARAV